MSNFLLSVFKGLYPVYLCLLVAGVSARIIRRKWTAFDTFLLASFLFFELSASLQVPLFYGIAATSKRYLWIGLPLGLPFAAAGLLQLTGFVALKKFSAVLCIALAGMNIYNTYSPVIHERHSVKKNAERVISRETAIWISNDWKEDHTLPAAVLKCDQYQSGKRPLVQSDFTRIGYLCGGQNYPVFFASRNIMPDYIVSRLPAVHPDYVLVKETASVKIYKSRQISGRQFLQKSH